MADPRVRLSPLAGDGDAASVLAALDRVHVALHLPSDAQPATLIASAALVAMARRLFGRVRVVGPQEVPTNWWGASTFNDFAGPTERDVEPVDAVGTIEYLVAVGDALVTDQPALYMGGGNFTARIGTTPQMVDELTHGLGLHVAGCLVVGRLLTVALADLAGPPIDFPPSYLLDLISHHVDTTTTESANPGRSDELNSVVIAGCGSVGSSTAALLGTALHLSGLRPPNITLVDPDPIDPDRNRWRYPALGGETGSKTDWIVDRLGSLGITATGVGRSVGAWNSSLPTPGLQGLLVSSVDTLEGRLEVADVLARDTLSVGVAGTALHVQRERFDQYACPFCAYVSADPPMTQATVYAELTGLDQQRVLQLLQAGALLDQPDLDRAVSASRIAADRAHALLGRPLQDLVRQAYAEVQVPSAGGTVLSVAAPHVSWFSGAIAAIEIIKQMVDLPLLDRRVDVDLGGLPPGLVRRSRSDTTGRCVCRSGVRRDWYDRMYGAA